MGQRICSVDGCETAARWRSFCQRHHRNIEIYGTPHRPCENCGQPITAPNKRFCTETCRPPCLVDGCGQPRRKNGWCASHYAQWKRLGEVRPFGYKWGETGQDCKVCGTPVPERSGRRAFCSSSCESVFSNHRGARPDSSNCLICGSQIDFRRATDGRLARTDQRWCKSCKLSPADATRWRRYAVTPQRYAEALDAGCDLCGQKVARLDVDHDHSCCDLDARVTCGNCVRGFLCNPCNRGLGVFGDNPELLRKALRYLNKAIE